MTLNLSSASLRALVSLAEKREKLTSELSAIEAQIAVALGGAAPSPGKGALHKARRGSDVENGHSANPGKKRGKRGATKELILNALKAAGAAGISVKDLSAKLALKNQNVHVWFNTTGKKLTEIEKTGKGVYRFNAPNAKVEAPKTAKKPVKAKGSRAPKRKLTTKKPLSTGKK